MTNTLVTLFVMISLLCVSLACFSPSLATILMMCFVSLSLITPSGLIPSVLSLVLWLIFGLFVTIRLFPKVRKNHLSSYLYKYTCKSLPQVNEIERGTMEISTTNWEAEIFSGDPDWTKLFETPQSQLNEEELSFIDNQVNQYLDISSHWNIHKEKDLKSEQWEYLKQEKFFALTISKEHGGLGFSDEAHAAIITKIATHCITSAVTVMAPNSSGLAQLLARHGTDNQRNQYLPLLASGKEIPCFAATFLSSESDVENIPDTGQVRRRIIDGEEVIGFCLTVDKKYITLAPVATLVGLAFKAFDPDCILGDAKELGITCVLFPADTEGLEIGNRHNTLDAHFMNGTIRGENIFIPLSTVIGGNKNIGHGWKMLVECSCASRGISLPSLANASGQKYSLVTGAYAKVRKQSGLSIGKLESVAEPLANIAINAYIMDAGCQLMTTALKKNKKPAVLSAMLKNFNTERLRTTLGHAMDIHAGKAIGMGPNNYIAKDHTTIPIAIAAEGANAVTRSVMVFGPGIIQSHPFIQLEMAACANPDKEEGLAEFDALLVEHLGHIITNKARAFIFGISAGILAPKTGQNLPKTLEIKAQKAHQISASLAYVSDISIGYLGNNLKHKEMLTGNLSDAWTAITMLSACLKKWVDEGRHEADLLLVSAACDDLLETADKSLDKALSNYPNIIMGNLMKWATRPFGSKCRGVLDKDKFALAGLLLTENDALNRLTKNTFVSKSKDNPINQLLETRNLMGEYEQLQKKMKNHGYNCSTLPIESMLEKIIEKDILTEREADRYLEIFERVKKIVDVDEFSQEEYKLA